MVYHLRIGTVWLLLVICSLPGCDFISNLRNNDSYIVLVELKEVGERGKFIAVQQRRFERLNLFSASMETETTLIVGRSDSLLKFTFSNVSDRDIPSIKALFNARGNLAFWETAENKELYPIIDSANKLLSRKLFPERAAKEEDVGTMSGSRPDTGNLAGKSLLQQLDEKKVKEPRPEKFSEEDNPLIGILQPAIYLSDVQQYSLRDGPVIGYADQKDTDRIMSYLRMPEIAALFPHNVLFLWGFRPTQRSGSTFELVAVRKQKEPEEESFSGDIIHSAEKYFDTENGGRPQISMTMTPSAAIKWKKMTASNIGRSIAIVIDGKVITYPTVQNEIPNGRSSITGDFTVSEANQLVSLLLAGPLPYHFTIVSEEFVEGK